MTRGALLIALTALLALSCTEPTQALVTVQIDPALQARLDRIDASLADASWRLLGTEASFDLTGSNKVTSGFSFGALPTDGVVRLVVSGYAVGQAVPVVEQRFEREISGDGKTSWTISLSAQCAEYRCAGPATCVSEQEPRCVSVVVSPTSPAMVMDSGTLDTSVPASDAACPCSDTHVMEGTLACMASQCFGSCEPGWKHCGGNFDVTGCETPMNLPTSCLDCNVVCPFGVCGDDGCVQEPAFGTWKGTKEVTWTANRMYGYRMPVTFDATLLGLGLRVKTGSSYPTANFMLGLYEAPAPSLMPGVRIAQTTVLSTDTAALKSAGAVSTNGGVEQVVAPRTLRAGQYVWFFFISNSDLQVIVEDAQSIYEVSTGVTYAGLGASMPTELFGTFFDEAPEPIADAYLIVNRGERL